MSYTNWNPVQACVWIASQDDAAVSSLPEDYTFAVLNFYHELELIDSDDDDHAVVIDKGMTFGRVHELLDQIAEYLGPSKANRPGSAWIGGAQKELLAACGHGALKMTGRSLYGGLSREIPAEAFATFQFVERDGVDCLGPPNLVDVDCWRDLRLKADDVRRVWPKNAAAPSKRTAHAPAVAAEPRDVGRPKDLRKRMQAWRARKYPGGVPPDAKREALLAEFQADEGVQNGSIRTLGRAMGRK